MPNGAGSNATVKVNRKKMEEFFEKYMVKNDEGDGYTSTNKMIGIPELLTADTTNSVTFPVKGIGKIAGKSIEEQFVRNRIFSQLPEDSQEVSDNTIKFIMDLGYDPHKSMDEGEYKEAMEKIEAKYGYKITDGRHSNINILGTKGGFALGSLDVGEEVTEFRTETAGSPPGSFFRFMASKVGAPVTTSENIEGEGDHDGPEPDRKDFDSEDSYDEGMQAGYDTGRETTFNEVYGG